MEIVSHIPGGVLAKGKKIFFENILLQ